MTDFESKFHKKYLFTLLISIFISLAVCFCVNVTGAQLNPALAIGMNFLALRNGSYYEIVSHSLIFWFAPMLATHCHAVYVSKKLVKIDEKKEL